MMSEIMKSLTAKGLEQLCSKQQLHLLNAVDSLRSQGVSHYISLPQIIVCGDQSSGKSSVLESISGVSFPVKSSLCTRFPTELILRKTAPSSINVSIVPHHSRSTADKERLLQFSEKLLDFKELPELIEVAKTAMGVTTTGKAFSEDILRVEVNGPDRPHLTIVDLPGLIHSENKHQSESDIQLVKSVVQGYMEEPRSIILAVVSAKNDYANQIVLKLARDADPRGTRTLGVITKPDTLIPGSGSEKMFVSLARNQDVEFRLGWHVLRNCDTEAENWTFDQRDAAELEFLSSGAWADLSSKDLGIQSLRSRLSNVLVRQIAAELPNLMKEIVDLTSKCRKSLGKLGLPRKTIDEQRLYLLQISQSFQALLQAATHGSYNDPYFGDAMSCAGHKSRIRAVVQNLNRDFAEDMTQHGRRYTVVANLPDAGDSAPESSELLTRADYLRKIILTIQRGRGRELPGMFNPMIVTELFKELSSPWGKIAESHIQQVWEAVRLSLSNLVMHAADLTTSKSILANVVDPKLNSLRQALHDKLAGLLKPHQSGHPITYNHYFTETLQNIRQERERSRVTEMVKKAFGLTSLPSQSDYVAGGQLLTLIDQLTLPKEPDMDHFAASEALDCLDAYYKVALKRFIDDVAVEVVETCLLDQLGEILDPTSIFRMSDTEVSSIAAETEESRGAREKLELKLKILNSGSETCKEFVALYVNVRDISEEDAEEPVGISSDAGTAPARTLDSDQQSLSAAVPDSTSSENIFVGDEQRAGSVHEPVTPTLFGNGEYTVTAGGETGIKKAPSKKKKKKSKSLACKKPAPPKRQDVP